MPKKVKETVWCHGVRMIFKCRRCFVFGYLAVGDTDGRGQEVATDRELCRLVREDDWLNGPGIPETSTGIVALYIIHQSKCFGVKFLSSAFFLAEGTTGASLSSRHSHFIKKFNIHNFKKKKKSEVFAK
jgi:hypothetical protein